MPTALGSSGPERPLFHALLWLHRWSSIVVTPFFLVLCLSGSILTFQPEIDHAFGWANEVRVPTSAKPASLSRIVAAASAGHSGFHAMGAEIDDGFVSVTLGPPKATSIEDKRNINVDVNAYTASVLPMVDSSRRPTSVLLDLHSNWLNGDLGRLFGSVVALTVFISLISGLAIYAPYVRDALFTISPKKLGRRARQVDLHIVVGIVVLGWAVLVTCTGFAQAVSNVASRHWQQTELAQLSSTLGSPHPPTSWKSIDAIAAAANRNSHGGTVVFYAYPNTDSSTPNAFVVFVVPTAGRGLLLDALLVDATTGRTSQLQPQPWYLNAIAVAGPLHFGNYGGLGLKILWLACAWSALAITVNGAWLWWMRLPWRQAFVRART